MYTYADAVTWFPDPVLVAEFRIRHYAAELKDRASRYSLIRKERSAGSSGRLPKCGCQLQSLPLRRFGLYGVPLSVCKSQPPAPNLVSGGVTVVV